MRKMWGCGTELRSGLSCAQLRVGLSKAPAKFIWRYIPAAEDQSDFFALYPITELERGREGSGAGQLSQGFRFLQVEMNGLAEFFIAYKDEVT